MRGRDLSQFYRLGQKIIGITRNYRSLIADKFGGKAPDRPVVFLKPVSAYVTEGQSIKIPKGCQELHHEVELGVVIGRQGFNINEDQAMDYVAGYTIALDMSAHDRLQVCRKEGTPWDVGKGFDTSCPVGQFTPKEAIRDPNALDLWCKVNGQVRQKGNTSDLVFKIPQILSYISQYYTLQECDLILTGTPVGYGPVRTGDIVEAGITGMPTIKFRVEDN